MACSAKVVRLRRDSSLRLSGCITSFPLRTSLGPGRVVTIPYYRMDDLSTFDHGAEISLLLVLLHHYHTSINFFSSIETGRTISRGQFGDDVSQQHCKEPFATHPHLTHPPTYPIPPARAGPCASYAHVFSLSLPPRLVADLPNIGSLPWHTESILRAAVGTLGEECRMLIRRNSLVCVLPSHPFSRDQSTVRGMFVRFWVQPCVFLISPDILPKVPRQTSFFSVVRLRIVCGGSLFSCFPLPP